MKLFTIQNALWLLLYLIVMRGGVWGLHRAHDWALASFGATSAEGGERQRAWDEWRKTAAQQANQEGPVQRRVPKSVEPPTLVLLRDYYFTCLAAFVLFGSVLFATCMFLVRGMLSSPGKVRPD